MSIHVVVDVDVLPGKLGEASTAFAELAALTLTEPGCSQFDVLVPEQENDKLVLVETWDDQDAIDLHMKEDYTARFLQLSPTLLPHPPRPRRLAPVTP